MTSDCKKTVSDVVELSKLSDHVSDGSPMNSNSGYDRSRASTGSTPHRTAHR